MKVGSKIPESSNWISNIGKLGIKKTKCSKFIQNTSVHEDFYEFYPDRAKI
jgi:hypothetical protein